MSLKARLNDSNKNLVMMTLATVGTIATAMGPAVEKHSKVSAPRWHVMCFHHSQDDNACFHLIHICMYCKSQLIRPAATDLI